MSTQPIKMPSLSDTMQSGHLLRWLKRPGDRIKKGDILAEIESDKAVMDMEAFSDGYLMGPLAKEDADYDVAVVIAYLSDEVPNKTDITADTATTMVSQTADYVDKPTADNPTADEPEAALVSKPEIEEISATVKPVQPPTGDVKHPHGMFKASPYARGLARELGIDLAFVAADTSGIIKSPQVIAAALNGTMPDLDAGPAWRYKLFTPMHRAIANNMSATLHTPMFSVSASLPVDALQAVCHENHVSFSLLMARAIAKTVVELPNFNATYTPFGMAMRKQVDVGIAVDMPGGLVTPVLRNMAERPMADLASDWKTLKQKVISQRLKPEDYQGATIYLSNLGMFDGITRFDAVVPAGACAILALGATEKGKAEITLTADHRVVYGADAARFLQALLKQVESAPLLLDEPT